MSTTRSTMRRRRMRGDGAWGSGHHRRRSTRMQIVSALLGLLMLGLGGAGVMVAGVTFYALARYSEIAEAVVPPEQIIDEYSRGGARIYDREGRLLYEFVDKDSGLRRPVPLSEIAEWMAAATISTEDASFYENNGLNMRGLIRAGIENLTPFSGDPFEGSGGSSITQQLAKNVYIPTDERSSRSIDRKIRETVIALELTQKYSKDQILEWYLNSISYGGIYWGIEAAAQGYFDKPASDLTLAESALLAGIPQSPALYAPLQGVEFEGESVTLAASSPTRARQLEVLDLMVRHGSITPEQAEEARRERIEFHPSRFEIEAPHFVLGRVLQEITNRFGERALFGGGLEVTTTIDLDLQHAAQEIIEQYLTETGEGAGLYNSALVALDPKTGQILTYVGSRDYFRDDIEGRNDNAVAQNSPGSTLKPFTFMTTFMMGWGTGTAILDTPYTYTDPSSGETFTPRDPIGTYLGPIPVAKALGNSLNITAVKAINYAGVDRVIDVLKQVGFTTIDDPTQYGPSLTVGGVDITLFDEVIGFSVLANNGVLRGQEVVTDEVDPDEREIEPVSLLKVTDPDGEVLYEFTEPVEQQVVEPAFPYLVTSILSDGSNQCITYGRCNALALPDGRPSAAKTGTSEPFENSRDIGETWTTGYTPNLVVGVWSGNADNSPLTNISSATVSLWTWRAFMMRAIEKLDLPPEPFERPPGVVEREVCWPSGKLPTDDCPDKNRYKSLYAESVLPRSPQENPDAYDSWWQRVTVDKRSGLLASLGLRDRFAKEEVRLVFPEDEVKDWEGLKEWARANDVLKLLGTGSGDNSGPPPVQITSPAPDQTVRGSLVIRGTADTPDFERYVVQWGKGKDPKDWEQINESGRPVTNNTLAVWDTTEVDDGDYTIRVVVEDKDGEAGYYQIPVKVENGNDRGGGGGGGGDTPQLLVVSPANGATVQNVVTIAGFATSPDLDYILVEVGQGSSPRQWLEVEKRSDPAMTGTLARWDTRDIPDGPYTIRVTVRDKSGATEEVTVEVIVQNGGG